MEHSYLYQYNLVAASHVLLGIIQTETPYFQPEFSLAAASDPKKGDPRYDTPEAPDQMHAYSTVFRTPGPHNVLYGAGLYSFFINWSTDCSNSPLTPCQREIVRVDGLAASSAPFRLHNLNTHGAEDVAVFKNASRMHDDAVPAVGAAANGFCSTVSYW